MFLLVLLELQPGADLSIKFFLSQILLTLLKTQIYSIKKINKFFLNKIKILLIFSLFNSYIFSNISLEDLDLLRSFTDQNSQSIILSGTNFCNNFFSSKEGYLKIDNQKFNNIFSCKFSKKRNRFYIYMLSVEKKDDISLKEFCVKILDEWPELSDHTDKRLSFQNKKYLDGFFIDNLFNEKIISFTNNFQEDQKIIQNEINNFIIKNRNNFTEDNKSNNLLIKKELNKIEKIYKKVASNSRTDLDIIIKTQLNEILRYKIFVNDIKKFTSYSCNWKPGKGKEPYIKREKFSEFENI